MIARSARDMWGRGAVVGLILAFAGCAPASSVSTGPPPAPVTPPPAAQATRVTPPAPPRVALATMVTDSTPSEDAERVLATIPEPLGGPPQPLPRRATPAPVDAYDTLRVTRDSDDGVPVPAPTEPMRPAPVQVSPVDSAASRPAPVVTPPPSTTANPPPAATPARPDPPRPSPRADGVCWRLQVAAPAERDKAESRLAAAESLLLLPFVIEPEKGLYKVRTRDCMTKEAADQLRRRAELSGFEGSFATRVAPPR
jgi:cell division septation protein DedD